MTNDKFLTFFLILLYTIYYHTSQFCFYFNPIKGFFIPFSKFRDLYRSVMSRQFDHSSISLIKVGSWRFFQQPEIRSKNRSLQPKIENMALSKNVTGGIKDE